MWAPGRVGKHGSPSLCPTSSSRCLFWCSFRCSSFGLLRLGSDDLHSGTKLAQPQPNKAGSAGPGTTQARQERTRRWGKTMEGGKPEKTDRGKLGWKDGKSEGRSHLLSIRVGKNTYKITVTKLHISSSITITRLTYTQPFKMPNRGAMDVAGAQKTPLSFFPTACLFSDLTVLVSRRGTHKPQLLPRLRSVRCGLQLFTSHEDPKADKRWSRDGLDALIVFRAFSSG